MGEEPSRIKRGQESLVLYNLSIFSGGTVNGDVVLLDKEMLKYQLICFSCPPKQ
jgi:hypothetical protein